VISYLES
jgi:WD40 repeat protein